MPRRCMIWPIIEPWNSAGPSTSTFMIGSRICGLARGVELAEGAARGFLERDVATSRPRATAPSLMTRADADDGTPMSEPLREHRLEALVAGRDELARDRRRRRSRRRTRSLAVRSSADRLDVAGDAAVLARAAGLLLVRVVEVGALGDGLAVGDLRAAVDELHAVLALHALDVDVEVELAHAGDDRLVGLLVAAARGRSGLPS